jgi:hypothetical protein
VAGVQKDPLLMTAPLKILLCGAAISATLFFSAGTAALVYHEYPVVSAAVSRWYSHVEQVACREYYWLTRKEVKVSGSSMVMIFDNSRWYCP